MGSFMTRGIAASAAMLAGLAVGTASPASAETTMSGHYTWASTTPTGRASYGDWYFTPCGYGCASATSTPGGPIVGQARLVNGQWTMDGDWAVGCSDGTTVEDSYVDTWDQNTLAGTDALIQKVAACGLPAGHQQINTLQLSGGGAQK
jgi:hypothetical protein